MIEVGMQGRAGERGGGKVEEPSRLLGVLGGLRNKNRDGSSTLVMEGGGRGSQSRSCGVRVGAGLKTPPPLSGWRCDGKVEEPSRLLGVLGGLRNKNRDGSSTLVMEGGVGGSRSRSCGVRVGAGLKTPPPLSGWRCAGKVEEPSRLLGALGGLRDKNRDGSSTLVMEGGVGGSADFRRLKRSSLLPPPSPSAPLHADCQSAAQQITNLRYGSSTTQDSRKRRFLRALHPRQVGTHPGGGRLPWCDSSPASKLSRSLRPQSTNRNSLEHMRAWQRISQEAGVA